MALTSGTKLGPYEIQSPLGSGGMGEVYRATDTKLGRDVALKVLPGEMAQDQAAMHRRYVASKRHTIQVDFDDYLHALGKERRAGSERARRQGFRLPVAPGAARAQPVQAPSPALIVGAVPPGGGTPWA